MKSTGLFGKNSGRVGGVVYSNYRGEQIVRSYQPKVSNPNTMGQIMQRAKFKLVSQLGASLGKELNSFMPTKNNESSRNAWQRAMLKKTTYSAMKKEASLPAEEIVLTSSKEEVFVSTGAQPEQVDFLITSSEWREDKGQNVRAHYVIIGYNEGGQISVIESNDIETNGEQDFIIAFSNEREFQNVRALVFLYKPNEGVDISFDDYEMSATEVTLADIQRTYGRNLHYTATLNIAVPQRV